VLLSPKSFQLVMDAVNEAGQAALAIQREGNFSNTLKSDRSPVTIADLESNNLLVATLSSLDETFEIISEEQDHTEPNEDSFWLVDPLDGTKEFIRGLPDFTVNVALVDEGVPTLGFVYAPGRDFMAWTDGRQFFTEGELRLEAKTEPETGLNTNLKVAVSASHMDPFTSKFVEGLGKVSIRSVGSSLKIAALAVGEADLYPRFGPTMLWDTAAADACLRITGGALIDPSGNPLRYDPHNLRNPTFLGLSPEIAQSETYIALMREVLEQDLNE
jgi:3'(2'), 5'-bisphosphate nucleotidase